MGNAGSSATNTWSRACATTGRAIGDGPDLLFLSSLSKEDRHEAKAMIKEQNFLKAKTEWLDQMISNTSDKMASYEYESDEWKELNERCQKEYHNPKLQALTRLKVIKKSIKDLRKKAMKKTGENIATPIKATVSLTGEVLKKTSDVIVAGTTETVAMISKATKTDGEKMDNPTNDEINSLSKETGPTKAETTASESAPVGEKTEEKVPTKANRRESMIAKEKQIDELVGDAELYKNNLEKLEEEGISEEQIAQRMKELEAES